jgi:two-component system copper resistance phosphate regulon response regulator CusR
MKLLLVEDDHKTAAVLKKGLTENGFVMDTASSGDDGFHLARNGGYDLVILDVLLPGRDGWSVLRELRLGGLQTPVLLLTARDSVADRVRGLELGADDYLIKPFAFTELLARVRTVLRRGPVRTPEVVLVADLEIDPVRHKVTRDGRALDLTPKEFALLSLLARRCGEVLTRTLITEQVWDVNFDPDANVIDVHVRRLRAKVDDPYQKKLIHTIRGVGYVLEDRD